MRLNLRGPWVHSRSVKPNSAEPWLSSFPKMKDSFSRSVKSIHVDAAALTPARSLLDYQCRGYRNPSLVFVTIY